jgi:hypothetical protein
MMKLKNKLMLFEEFAETRTTVDTKVSNVDVKQNVDVNVDVKPGIRTDIVKDVDTIINKLEYLANNMEGVEEFANESQLNEGTVDQIVSAELYMIPVIAAGVVGAAGIGVGVLIKRAVTKAKIRAKHKKVVRANKIKAAKMEIYVKELRDYKKQDFDDRSKQKVQEFNKKIEELKQAAEDMNSALIEKYPKYTDFIGTLNSEVRMEIAQFMLDSKLLTDTEKERYQKTYRNAVRSLDRRLKKAEEEKKAAEEKVKNASKEDLARIEAEKEKLQQEFKDKEETEDSEA